MKKPPQIKLEILTDDVNKNTAFIKKESHYCEISYPDTDKKRQMILESIVRRSQDAVVIIAYKNIEGQVFTWLRSAFRSASHIRSLREPDYEFDGNLWEFPAGLVDKGEAPIEAAKREFKEEVGFDIELNRFKYVQTVLPMPSLIAERLYFYTVEITDSDACGVPCLDGSPLEEGGEVITASLNELLDNIQDIVDVKTNLGIRILKEIAHV